jgi:purine-nucleoside phosphorylase
MFTHPELEKMIAAIRAKSDFAPAVAVVLGSGLSALSSRIEVRSEIPYQTIHPDFATNIEGHAGTLMLGTLGRSSVALFVGRRHYYEGVCSDIVTLPVQIARQLGAEGIILTSAVGALNENYVEGDVVLLEDQLNLMGTNPFIGKLRRNPALAREERNRIFLDMSDLYETGFEKDLAGYALSIGARLRRGVLAGVLGPVYETAAEQRMLRSLGADIVSMSTIPEAIMARYLGLRVAGISLVTNSVGVKEPRVTHAQVLESAAAYSEKFASVLAHLLELFP